MDQKELEAAITKLQDIEEIKRLHARYGYLIDSGRMEDVADLFTDDAIADWGGLRGRYEGKKAISGFFVERTPKTAAMLRHQFVQRFVALMMPDATAQSAAFGERHEHAALLLHGFMRSLKCRHGASVEILDNGSARHVQQFLLNLLTHRWVRNSVRILGFVLFGCFLCLAFFVNHHRSITHHIAVLLAGHIAAVGAGDNLCFWIADL